MALKIRCPRCSAIKSVNERVLGKEIQCPKCGGKLRLPAAEEVAELRGQAEQSRQFQRQLEAGLQRLAPVTSQQPWESVESADSDIDWNAALRTAPASAEERRLAAAAVSFKRPKSPDKQEMDMTPMVDVTFLLLIFFMITASFVVQKSIQRPAQRSDEASLNAVPDPEDESDTVFVQVDEFNAYNVVVGGVDTPAGSKQDLIVLLSAALTGGGSARPPSKLVIDAHENCIHAAVIAALDAGREAQFESFEVRTVEQFD